MVKILINLVKIQVLCRKKQVQAQKQVQALVSELIRPFCSTWQPRDLAQIRRQPRQAASQANLSRVQSPASWRVTAVHLHRLLIPRWRRRGDNAGRRHRLLRACGRTAPRWDRLRLLDHLR
jgi:hypothetical protein